ncbi:MAG: hypothetical protein ACFE7R_07545 [Candidatus Hodarchaeota archaeon]
MKTADEILLMARDALKEGRREDAARLLVESAEIFSAEDEYVKAATLFERAGLIFKDIYEAYDCFKAFENATINLVRQPSSPETHKKIVELNSMAGKISEEATEYKRASDFYFRAADFAVGEEKRELTLKAADALENLADIREEENDLESSVSLLKKVGRLYYTCGEDELGRRINDRAVRIATRWATKSKQEGNPLGAGNALAEAAQIMQATGESPEAPRLMMEAGEFYEAVELYEKAGNIYDAAQEAYQMLRQTTARKSAMTKAAEAYVKMQGRPEVVAPLLVKAGNLFWDLGSDVKAKWAFKRGSELFGELAKKAAKDDDIDSEKSYLRFQAMCLKKWGSEEEADELYRNVIEYYLGIAANEEVSGDKEAESIALESAAEVLEESGNKEKAREYLRQSLQNYVELAEEYATNDQNDESSKFYSKAADCAKKLGELEQSIQYHEIASQKAEAAANYYSELGVKELATIWTRTAGNEALKTQKEELIDKAISLLRNSAAGFAEIQEIDDAFEDLFSVFEAMFLHHSENREEIAGILSEMDEMTRSSQDLKMESLMAVLHPLDSGNHTAALLALQEREEELLQKRERLRRLVEHSKVVRAPEDSERTGRTHWLYK